MKRCFTPLVTGELPSKTAVRAPVVSAKTEIPMTARWWGRRGRPLSQLRGKLAGSVLQSQRVLTVGTRDPTPRDSIRRNGNLHSHKACTRMFTAAFFMISKSWRQTPTFLSWGREKASTAPARRERCSAAGVGGHRLRRPTLSAKSEKRTQSLCTVSPCLGHLGQERSLPAGPGRRAEYDGVHWNLGGMMNCSP